VLIIGSFLRKDHPLFAQRIRQAARKGAKVHSLHALQDEWLMPMAGHFVLSPSSWLNGLCEVAAAVASHKGISSPWDVTPSPAAQQIAATLMAGEQKAILLGNLAAQHPQATDLLVVANWIAEQTGSSVGYLTEAANTVGAQLVGAMPGSGGLNAGQMLSSPKLKACLLLNVEPALDVFDPTSALSSLQALEMVVALTPFKSVALDVADVLLPIAPFTETSGTFVNAEGRVQSFHGVVKPLGETRPAWKVLRVLANLLNLNGFDFETSEDVRQQALGDVDKIATRLTNRCSSSVKSVVTPPEGLQRLADVPIYAVDSTVRRADSLQRTADARVAHVGIGTELWDEMGLIDGMSMRVHQGQSSVVLPARLDASLAPQVVRVPAGLATTVVGPMFGTVRLEKV
jgi:NADH-quinone oxidoreductase subunit G